MAYLQLENKPNNMSLLVVGTVAFDALETPFGKTDKITGGSANYFSWSASNFIKDIKLVSVVGDDYDFEEIERLKKRGVDMEGLQVKKGEKSFFWSGKYHLDMNSRDTLATELNVLADFDPVIPESYKNCEFVMLGNLTPVVQLQVLDQMNQKPKLVALDTMNFWMDIMMDDLKKVLQRTDVLIINDEEARQLSGEFSIVKGAKKNHGYGSAVFGHQKRRAWCPAVPWQQRVFCARLAFRGCV